MSTPQKDTTVSVQGTDLHAEDLIERATVLAGLMTANPDVTPDGTAPWTVQDVIAVAIRRGVEALEDRYGVKP